LSNIKFLEQSGAKVVPIRVNLPKEELKILLDSVNGVYIPGSYDNIYDKNRNYTSMAKNVFRI